MYLKIVCLNDLNRNHFYLLPLRLLLLPLNKNCFNTWLLGDMEFLFSLNTRREIPYLRAPMYYCLFNIHLSYTIYDNE